MRLFITGEPSAAMEVSDTERLKELETENKMSEGLAHGNPKNHATASNYGLLLIRCLTVTPKVTPKTYSLTHSPRIYALLPSLKRFVRSSFN